MTTSILRQLSIKEEKEISTSCEICFDEVDNLFNCEICRKSFCIPCLRSHIHHRDYDFICPHCSSEIPYSSYKKIYSRNELEDEIYMKIADKQIKQLKEIYTRNYEQKFKDRIVYYRKLEPPHSDEPLTSRNTLMFDKNLFVTRFFSQYIKSLRTRAQINNMKQTEKSTVTENKNRLINSLGKIIAGIIMKIEKFDSEFDVIHKIAEPSKIPCSEYITYLYVCGLKDELKPLYKIIDSTVNLETLQTVITNLSKHFITNTSLGESPAKSLTAAIKLSYNARFGHRISKSVNGLIDEIVRDDNENRIQTIKARNVDIYFAKEKCPLCDFGSYTFKNGNTKFCKCDSCDKYICYDCNESHPFDQECNKDSLMSRKAILQCSKPCPNCGIRIIRSQGCSQMFCTYCKTGFEWTNGKIITSNFHNPHRMDWLQGKNEFGIVKSIHSNAGIKIPEINRDMNAATYIFLFEEILEHQPKKYKLEILNEFRRKLFRNAIQLLEQNDRHGRLVRNLREELARGRDYFMKLFVRYRLNEYMKVNDCQLELSGIKPHANLMYIRWKIYKHLLTKYDIEDQIRFYEDLYDFVRNQLMIIDQALISDDYETAVETFKIIARGIYKIFDEYKSKGVLNFYQDDFRSSVLTYFNDYPHDRNRCCSVVVAMIQMEENYKEALEHDERIRILIKKIKEGDKPPAKTTKKSDTDFSRIHLNDLIVEASERRTEVLIYANANGMEFLNHINNLGSYPYSLRDDRHRIRYPNRQTFCRIDFITELARLNPEGIITFTGINRVNKFIMTYPEMPMTRIAIDMNRMTQDVYSSEDSEEEWIEY